MANIRLIKRRIKSAGNIAQITRAMELVAASKMKRAQAAAIAGKTYAQKIYDMVVRLSAKAEAQKHPLLRRSNRAGGKRLLVLLSTNKGLCGGLNANLSRFLVSQYRVLTDVNAVSVGKKGTAMLLRTGAVLTADFSDTIPRAAAVPALTAFITESYASGTYDRVDVVFSEFHSVVMQEPRMKTLLPITIEALPEQKKDQPIEFLIEPSVDEVFEALLPHYIENQLRDALFQAEASEHASRMIAMRNATDNAMALMEELTLLYNKARQEKITYEITDMVTARLAVAE
ncbi:ATP synthase F1 subunit gamma [Candidatus Gottesmanbacteria bacterium]|nr:ATP synthase F1 subunit gamma [Candidatus Gottesmanbacteria bacterium]